MGERGLAQRLGPDLLVAGPIVVGNSQEFCKIYRKQSEKKTYRPSLKLTAKTPENGWLEDDRFLLEWLIFRGEMLGFRECTLESSFPTLFPCQKKSIGHFALPEGPKHDSAGAENGCQGDFVTKVQSAEKAFVLPYPLKFKIDTQNIWGMCLFL